MHAQLEQEQLVVGQASARGADLLHRRGAVHHPVGLAQGHEPALAPERLGQVIVDEAQGGVEHALDGLLDAVRVDDLAGGVDGAQALGAGLGLIADLGQDLDARVGQLQQRAVPRELALQTHAHPWADAVLQVRAVEPGDVEASAVIGDDRLEARAGAASRDPRGRHQPAGRHNLVQDEIGDARLGGLELVAHGQVGHQPADVGEPEGPEIPGGLGREDLVEGGGESERRTARGRPALGRSVRGAGGARLLSRAGLVALAGHGAAYHVSATDRA